MKRYHVTVLILLLALTVNACTPQTISAIGVTATGSDPAATLPATETSVAPPTETAMQPQVSAAMSEIKGSVQVKLPGVDAFSNADPSITLVESSQVQTGDDGHVRLDLSTGTIIRVSPSSIFTLLANTPTEHGLFTRLQLLLGRIFIILKGGSLDVETPSGVASVRGSYMSVTYDPQTGTLRITCLEGHCSLTDSEGTVDITTGQTAEISGVGLPPHVGIMSQQDIQTWLGNSPEAQLIIPTPTTGPLYYAPPAPTEVPTKNAAPPTPTSPPTFTPVVSITSISPSVSALVGQTITVSAGVVDSSSTAIPTGTVSILYGANILCSGTLDSSGQLSCGGTISTAGSFSFVANYSGDSTFAAAQSAGFSYSVIGTATTTVLNNPVGPSYVNEPVSFTAVVNASGSPTGYVTISDGVDFCSATSAPWTCSITFKSAGTKSVTATYSGDSNFNSSVSIAVSQIVNPYTPTVSNVDVYSPPFASFTPGANLDVKPTLYLGGWALLTFPTGTITITEPISGNSCVSSPNISLQTWTTCTITGALGINVDLNFSGDSNFASFIQNAIALQFLY